MQVVQKGRIDLRVSGTREAVILTVEVDYEYIHGQGVLGQESGRSMKRKFQTWLAGLGTAFSQRGRRHIYLVAACAD